jgi:hypothetical protein
MAGGHPSPAGAWVLRQTQRWQAFPPTSHAELGAWTAGNIAQLARARPSGPRNTGRPRRRPARTGHRTRTDPESAVFPGKKEMVEAAGIEPASRSCPVPGLYARSPRLVLALGAPTDGLPARQHPLVLAGPPGCGARRPARCWRLPGAAGAPRVDGYLVTRQRENSCWQISAVPERMNGGFENPGAPPGAERNRSKPVRPHGADPSTIRARLRAG